MASGQAPTKLSKTCFTSNGLDIYPWATGLRPSLTPECLNCYKFIRITKKNHLFSHTKHIKYYIYTIFPPTCFRVWPPPHVAAVIPHKVRVILNDKLQRESHNPYGPPTSVTWLQLPRKQTNTGISTALTAETRWSTRTRFRAFFTFVTRAQAR